MTCGSACRTSRFFYACGISPELGEFSAWDDVPGWLVAELTRGTPDEAAYRHLYGLVAVTPCLTVLPMGWTWSFCFGKLAHVHQVRSLLPLFPGAILEDKKPPPLLTDGTVLCLPYRDNLAGLHVPDAHRSCQGTGWQPVSRGWLLRT